MSDAQAPDSEDFPPVEQQNLEQPSGEPRSVEQQNIDQLIDDHIATLRAERTAEQRKWEIIKFAVLAIIMFVVALGIILLRPTIFDRIVPAVMDGDKTSSDLEGVKPEDETPTETEDAPDAGSEDETLIPVITSPQEESSGSGEEAEGPTAVPAQTYVVQQGDTLSSIARQFNTTVEAITAANDIPDPNNIQPGTTLTIPQS